MNNRWKRFLSLLLAMVMVLSLGVTGFADEGETEENPAETAEEGSIASAELEAAEDPAEEAEPGEVELEMEDISPDKVHVRKLGLVEDEELGEDELGEIVPMDGEDLNTVVRASIFLEAPSTLAAGYAVEGVGTNSAAIGYRNALKAQQAEMTAQIESVIGHELNVHWNLTLAANAISAELTLGEMVKVREIPGVRSVQRENQYLPMDEGTISDPNTANTSENMVGATTAWAAGYTGAGSKIAIIDTGIDTTHQSFAAEPFTYAVGLAGATDELMTQTQVSGLASQLNSKSSNYVSAKIPYGYNYVDNSTTIDHLSDTQGEHGSHVAGIAAANRYIGSAHNDAITAVGAVGMAPDAQLLIMKVFGSSGGAYDSDYMVAIEDAIVLGADVCNLSLGSSVQGWTFDNDYQDILNNLADGEHNVKMVVSISAGNSYDLAYMTDAGSLYIEDVDMHTGGSPGTFVNSLCVAAAQNTLTTGTPMEFNGNQDVYYYESTGNEEEGTTYTNPALTTIVGTYDYVYIDAVGSADDYKTVNADVSLSGKVVLVNRGELSFVEKGENAKSYSPKAVIIANNKAGTIYMDLTDFTGTFPMVTITLDDAEQIKAGGTAHTVSGITYYTGSMKVTNTEKSVVIDRSEATITEFSSWGVPGSLIMKPEITAPGGDIYSVWGTNKTGSSSTAGGSDQYEYMSGTSMAAPHITGLTAVLAEALREHPIADRNSALAAGYSTRAITQSLMMSTATPMAPKDNYLSILQQGAGLADVSKAVTANSVIMMDPANSGLTGLTGAAADGKVKVELGDDPARKGDYSFGFTVYNLSDDDLTFTVDTDVFTQASDGEFMLRSTAGIDASATSWWAPLDGSSILNEHDVNRDGVTNEQDAQAILDYLTGEAEEDDLDLDAGEMGDDETLTTQDAYLLLGYVAELASNNQDGLVPAHGSRYCSVRITLPNGVKNSLDAEYPGGAYIEGFTTVSCVTTTKEGAVYTDEHSIPILGFYGSWTDASMFETTSYTENLYGNEQLPYTGTGDTNFLKLQMNGSSVKFSGNPYKVEGSAVTDFPSERLAINSNTNILSITYSLIRAAGTTGFAVSKLDEDHNVESVLSSSVVANDVNGIWYYQYGASWQNVGTKLYTVNKTPASYGLQEGDLFRIGFYAIPEYNGMAVNGSYNEAGAGALSQTGFNTLLTSNVLGKGAFVGYDFVVDNTEPQILSATLNGTKLTISAEDNQNLAYVAVLSLDGETVYAEQAPAKASCELSFDASDAIANAYGFVAVFAGDYAGNECAVAVQVNDNTHVERTIYIQTDTLTADEEYVIANTAQVGSGVILGHTGTTVGTNAVTVKTGDNTTGGRVYIDSKDVASTSVWTASSGIKLKNDEYYLRRNSRTGATLQVSTTDSYDTWQYSNNQLRFTDRATYLRYTNNSFSLNTSAGNIYIYQKVEQSFDVDPYAISGVTVTPVELSLYKGSTADLTAKVLPLTANDRSVTWSSSNTNVATVDESGKVTAVNGSSSGMTATITATANGDASKKAECTVTVYSIDKALNGIVWDEAGGVYFSSFNSSSLPTWNKLHSDDKQLELMSAFQNSASALYAGTLDMSSQSTELYTVNQSTYALTDFGTNYVMAFGMARASSSYTDYFVYGFASYLIFGNLTPEADDDYGTFSGFPYGLLELSETSVGDSYVCAVCAKSVGSSSSSFYFLDESGKIWQTTMTISNSVSFGTPTLVVDTEISTSFLYQSLYYDGTYLYWSHMADNETELIIIEPSTGRVFHAGNFGEGVWPVGGLFVKGSAAPAAVGDEPMAEAINLERVATRDELMTPDVVERLSQAFGTDVDIPQPEADEDEAPADEGSIEEEGSIAIIEPVAEDEPILEPVPAEGGEENAYVGSLLAFRGYKGAAPTVDTAEPQAADETITISIAASEDSHNGLIAVDYDPDLARFTGWTDGGNSSNVSVHPDDKGVITIAYANKDKAGDDIDAGEPIVTLTFTVADTSELGCGVLANLTTLECNDELEMNEQSDVLIPGAEGHDWGEPTWTWAADYSSATATFVCLNDETHVEEVDGEVTAETADGVTTYTATAVFEGKSYTDTKTVEAGPIVKVYGCSLSLEGDIALNFYLVIPDEVFEDADAYVTLNGNELPIAGARSVVQNGITMYEFKYLLAAKQMNDDVELRAYSGEGALLTLQRYSSGKDITADGYHYTVQRYIQLVLKNGGNEKLVALMKAMSDYGSKAQILFNYEPETAAAIYNPDAIAAVTAEDLAPYKRVTTKTDRTGIQYTSANLTLEAETTARLFFEVNEGSIEDYSFTVNGKAATPKSTSSGYAIEITNIAAKNLGTMYKVEVRDSEGVCLTVSYSALSYAYLVVNSDSSASVNVETMQALYLYYQAAIAYFN